MRIETTNTRTADAVICPYLASLLENGDLETNADGLIPSKCSWAKSLAWVGATSVEVVAAFLRGTDDFVAHDIFDLVGKATEHRFDTRIRSPECCNDGQMDSFASFGKEGRFGAEELGQAAAFFAVEANSPEGNDLLQSGPDVLIRVWGLFLAIFGEGVGCPQFGGTCTMAVDGFKSLYLDGKFPAGWQLRDWSVQNANAQIQKICDAAMHEDCPVFAVAFVPVPPVDLGAAGVFAILAKSGISTVPDSVITGDVGVSPIAGTAMTGFSLTASSTGAYATSDQVSGRMFAANYHTPTPSSLTKAVGDMETAYTDASSRAPLGGLNVGAGAGISGLTLAPGVYKWTENIHFDSQGITLDGMGNSEAVFILQTTGNVVAAAAATVVLKRGARAENIFWQVAGYVSAGEGAHLEGIFLVKTHVAFVTGSSVQGRLLTQTAVTLQKTTVTEPGSRRRLAGRRGAEAFAGANGRLRGH
ncbi:hypothetical protein M885DRAFT_570093 [Pelagophyceae sp. CCMP2097]|nr:hypothetical protein M885DRAFT_570093 [Pelagophyceae sp. CCMP2097]